MLTFSLVGCGGGVAIKNNEPQLTRATSTTISPNHIGTTNYHKILDDLGLRSVFTYGKVYETTKSVTIPLTPRDINSDQRTGRIITETQLLSKLGSRVASTISKETNIPQNRVELIVYEKRCKVHIINNRVTKNCDRDSTIQISPKKDDTPNQLRLLLSGVLNSGLPPETQNLLIQKIITHVIAKKTFNKNNVKEFCETTLREKLKDYKIKTDCIVVEKPSRGKKSFVIKGIETKKFITDKHPEKFNLQISNVLSEDDIFSKDGIASISPDDVNISFIIDPFSWLRPKNYPENIKILANFEDLIEDAEPKISDWAKEFIQQP